MLKSFVSALADALSEKGRVKAELLEDLQRVLRGEPQIYDRPDPNDPEGKYAFKITGKRDIKLAQEAVASAVEQHKRHEEMLFEMAFMYSVSIFDAFLQDLLTATFVARPETLRSGKQITYEKVLQLSDRGMLLQYLADRETLEISYKSIRDQIEYFRQRFGVRIQFAGDNLSQLEEIHARRNLLAHNAGIVNSIYREKVPRSRRRVGSRVIVERSYWLRASRTLDTVASQIASELTQKHT